MGTSKGYISPTNIPWRQAKRAVTAFIKDTSSGAKLNRAISDYAAAKVADARNYQIISNGIGNVANAIGAANSGGLNEYLGKIHREDLVGKSVEELFTSLLCQDENNGSTPEEQMLINTIPQVLENLNIVQPDDLQKLLPADFMAEFLGEFICNDFDRCFDEQIRRYILPRDYDRIIAEIHGFIKNTIYEMKGKLTQNLTSFENLADNSIVSSCMNDAYRIFADLYIPEE